MPKLDAFAITGLDIRMHSNDHLPPHIHVTRRGEWSIKVFFNTTTESNLDSKIVFGRRVPRAFKTELAKAVARNRTALLEEWESKVKKDC